jgi:hypothetical protein
MNGSWRRESEPLKKCTLAAEAFKTFFFSSLTQFNYFITSLARFLRVCSRRLPLLNEITSLVIMLRQVKMYLVGVDGRVDVFHHCQDKKNERGINLVEHTETPNAKCALQSLYRKISFTT